MGDVITLNIEIKGGNDIGEIDLSGIEKNFEILNGPSEQNNYQWINGKEKKSKTLSWNIAPNRLGRLKIPALSVIVDNRKLKGNSILIQVAKTSQNQTKDVFIFVDLDKESAFLGEQVTLTYKLYKRQDINIVSIDHFVMPDFKGFWYEELYTPQRLQYNSQSVLINGLKYQVANLGQRALFPIVSESHEIPPIKVKIKIEVKNKKRKRDVFFDPFFDSFFSETKTKILTTENEIIKIKTFPIPRPEDFTGAVGDFNINANIDRDKLIVNEGITFKIEMSGTGNIGLFSLPKIIFPDFIEVFKPTESFKKDKFRNQLTGTKIWEYILIPRKSGEITIPQMKMSIFDPKINNWKSISTKPFNLQVLRDSTTTLYNSGLTKKEVELIDKDIRYINTDEYKLNKKGEMNYSFIAVIYVFSGLFIIFPVVFSYLIGYRLSSENDRRISGAFRKNIKILRNKENGNEFEIASYALYSYLKDRLSLATNNLDPNQVRIILQNKVSRSLFDKINDLLVICDEGRFSPVAYEKRNIVIDEMFKILKQIEKELK